MFIIRIILAVFCGLFFVGSTAGENPKVQLARVYDANNVAVSDYLVSEKFDGVRAIWDGQQLKTRNGNVINAPEWFTAPLPNIWLDGELWTKRQDFANLSGIVRTQKPVDDKWRTVSYRVFDMPDDSLAFAQRYKNYTAVITQLAVPHIKAVEQHVFTTPKQLTEFLTTLTEQGAEGVMLHLASAKHQGGRSDALLKLKPYLDAEAQVIAHLPGKGKYQGMLGALLVRSGEGVEFKIGTGFTDKQRQHPPAIGSVISYQYHGYTKNGLPRFASFLRERAPE